MNGFRLILFSAVLTLCKTISPVFSQITAPRAWAEWEETDGIIIHQPNFYLQQDPSPVELMIAEE